MGDDLVRHFDSVLTLQSYIINTLLIETRTKNLIQVEY